VGSSGKALGGEVRGQRPPKLKAFLIVAHMGKECAITI